MISGFICSHDLRPQQGFTLIELAIVVLLLSLFSAISMPLLSHTDRGELNAAARRMTGAIRYLYNEAVLDSSQYRLLWDLDENSYSAKIQNAAGELEPLEDGKGQRTLKQGVRIEDIVIPGRGSFSQGQVEIRIYPSGWIEETIIHLRNSSGEQRTIRVNPLTGVGHIFDGYRTFEQ